MPQIILGIAISYLLGSIPTAYILGRLLKGIDIRKHGSGNIGATNALRVLGKGWGATVLALDMLKGFAAVVFIPAPQDTLRIIFGLACICGHNWTIFLNFKGGKGIATTFGVLIGLSIKIPGLKLIVGLLILTWLAVFLLSRTVSIASILTAVSLPAYCFIFRQSRIVLFSGILLCIFALTRHKSNIKRIFQGKEPRLF